MSFAIHRALQIAIVSASIGATAIANGVTLYVSPMGNDQWTGQLAEPDAGKTDGPLATLTRARDQLRRLRSAEGKRAGTVFLRGGVYFLDGPLTLAPEDSGSEAEPVVWTAYREEKPTLSAGRRLIGWQIADGRWQVTLPEVRDGNWNFVQLFAGDERRPRTRLPRNGWFEIEAELPRATDTPGRGCDRFQYRQGDLRSNWTHLEDVEVMAVHVWTMSRMRIKKIEESSRTVVFTGSTSAPDHWAKFPKGHRYFAENVREALDQPGEWYLERKTGVLTYLPKPGEDPGTLELIAPRLPQLLVLEGDSKAQRWVEHVTFRGIKFAHTNWVTPFEGHSFPQAEADVEAAIRALGARHCTFERCDVVLTGGYGIDLGTGCRFNRIEDCELVNLGAGGIKIGDRSLPASGARDAEAETAGDNVVRNCLLEAGGRVHPAGIGIWIGHSPRNTTEHNEITDFYYTGVSLGWSWGYQASLAHHNTIAWNRISKIGQGVLSDMGGIYTLGNGPGNILHHNVISDVDSLGYGGWGIYFDEGSTGFRAENNIVFRTKSAGFHQHYGRENVVRNNVFALGREAQLMRSRNEGHLSFTLERNIVYASGAPLFGSDWNGANFKLDANLYWDASGQAPLFPGGRTLSAWQKESGHDVHSLVSDPLFENPAAGDFRLKAESVAHQIGFEPIDTSEVGRRTPRRLPRASSVSAFLSP